MSYDALDDKQAEIEDGINSDPYLGELSCKVASQCLKELIAELRSLRAENERLSKELADMTALAKELDKELCDIWRQDHGSREPLFDHWAEEKGA